jgi:transposase, IS5 family
VEEVLYDRFAAVRFVGLSTDHDKVPGASTICRLRRSLVVRNMLKRLLDKRRLLALRPLGLPNHLLGSCPD